MTSFSERFRMERKRLNLSQNEFAALGGLRKNAQISYEGGYKSPTAAYLLKLVEIGVDVGYLFHGIRTNLNTSPELANLWQLISDLPPAQQVLATDILQRILPDMASKPLATVSPDIISRAAKIFVQFIEMSEHERLVMQSVAKAARDLAANQGER